MKAKIIRGIAGTVLAPVMVVGMFLLADIMFLSGTFTAALLRWIFLGY